jgi:multicomponent Na+:H+ antiporter subunit E
MNMRLALIRAFPAAAVWFALNGTDAWSWLLGVPACFLAGAASAKLSRAATHGPRLAALPSFVFYFATASWRGGVDVANLALARHCRLDPRMVRYVSRLPIGPARSLFCFTISVLPGTLVAGVRPDHLAIHCIGTRGVAEAELSELEERIARLFAIDLRVQNEDVS